MLIIDNYKDLCKQIDINEETISALEVQIYSLKKLMNGNAPKDIGGQDYSGMPRGSKDFTSLDRISARLKAAEEKIKILKDTNLELFEKKENIKDMISHMEGLNYKVAFMKEIKGMSIKEIARELNREEAYIKNVSYKIRRSMDNMM